MVRKAHSALSSQHLCALPPPQLPCDPVRDAHRPSGARWASLTTTMRFCVGRLVLRRLKTRLIGPVVQGGPSSQLPCDPDVATCVRGAQLLTKIVASNAMAPFRYDTPPISLFLLDPTAALITPGNFRGASPALPDVSNFTASAQWCKDTVTVIWHFHGGCHRGVCVDSSYRVNGVQALRVVDGSTFLTSPGTNPMATCLMLGRFIGLNLLEERGFNISAA
ncbi:unnamed protein product [Closterium sp. Yama58-4]|nr:unnamed protein product [Closterium sp. Yama58-4]